MSTELGNAPKPLSQGGRDSEEVLGKVENAFESPPRGGGAKKSHSAKTVILPKKLILSFIAVILAGVLAFAGINYLVDPFYFFRSYDNLDYYWGTFWGYNVNTRLRNACIIKNTPGDPIEGLIVGGSKSATIVEELVENYTGLKYFAAPVTGGDFAYYEDIIQYAVENQPIQHIVLHISGWEVFGTLPEDAETRRMPEFVSTGSRIDDVWHYLFADVSNALSSIVGGGAPAITERFNQQPVPDDLYSYTNPDNLELIQSMGLGEYENTADDLAVTARIHGAEWRSSYYLDSFLTPSSREYWADRYVLNYNKKDYDYYLEKIFDKGKRLKNVDGNLEHLENIVDLCDEHGIDLTVIVGASSFIERASYEGYEYWDYLYSMAQITDYYDFSYFCDINMNPCNFYDAQHNLDFVSCVMIDNIFGKGDIPYGWYVTAENVDSYIYARQFDYYALERQYRETGTVLLPGLGWESDLSSIPGEYWVEMLRRNGKSASERQEAS